MSNKLSLRRKARVRYNLKKYGGGKPRLSVFISNSHIYAQLIDDKSSSTIASSSSLQLKLKGANIKNAKIIGKNIAEKLSESKFNDPVVFDKGNYMYHGVVKALADSARENGLKF